MDILDLVFTYLTNLILANKTQSIAVSAVLLVVLILINKKTAKAAGRAFSDLLKRIPIIGVHLEKKIEDTQEAFNEGMREDEANLNSPNMPKIDNKPEVVTDPDVNSNECPDSNANKSNGD